VELLPQTVLKVNTKGDKNHPLFQINPGEVEDWVKIDEANNHRLESIFLPIIVFLESM
jgi:hypothetical protein